MKVYVVSLATNNCELENRVYKSLYNSLKYIYDSLKSLSIESINDCDFFDKDFVQNYFKEEYFERYVRLYRLGKEFGITVSQENVVHFRSQSPNFIKRMSDYLGEEFSMTLDLKQCRRAGENPFDFIEAVGEKIDHIHLSDYNENSDCLPPFEGYTNFEEIVSALNKKGYKGSYIIELYRKNFENTQQIVDAAVKFDKILL